MSLKRNLSSNPDTTTPVVVVEPITPALLVKSSSGYQQQSETCDGETELAVDYLNIEQSSPLVLSKGPSSYLSSGTFKKLPNSSVIYTVLTFLPQHDCVRMQLVNKKFYNQFVPESIKTEDYALCGRGSTSYHRYLRQNFVVIPGKTMPLLYKWSEQQRWQ